MYNILVISSEEMLVRQIAFYMEFAGHKVFSAFNAEQARSLNFASAHVVFWGETLVDASPFEVAGNLRERNPQLRKLPFVYCTHNHTDEFHAFCTAGHVFDMVMELPFERPQLEDVMLSLNLYARRAIALSPLDSLSEQAILKFLKFVGEHRASVIEPVYEPSLPLGYYYPETEKFFACDAGDSLKLLDMLYRRNLLGRRLADRIHCCPICGSHDVAFREVCPKCRSLDYEHVEILHHFPCGYIGDFDEFYHPIEQELVCPKCHKLLRHIGLDYEKPASAYKCRSCETNFAGLAVRGYCPHCAVDFESGKVVDREIYIYNLTPKGKQSVVNNSLLDLESSISNPGVPFTFALEVFRTLLHQDQLTAARLHENLYVMIFEMRKIPPSRFQEFLLMLNDTKLDSTIMMQDDGGRFVLHGFGIEREDLDARFQKLRERLDRIPELAPLPFRLYVECFLPSEKIAKADLLAIAYRNFVEVQSQFQSGIHYHETLL